MDLVDKQDSGKVTDNIFFFSDMYMDMVFHNLLYKELGNMGNGKSMAKDRVLVYGNIFLDTEKVPVYTMDYNHDMENSCIYPNN